MLPLQDQRSHIHLIDKSHPCMVYNQDSCMVSQLTANHQDTLQIQQRRRATMSSSHFQPHAANLSQS